MSFIRSWLFSILLHCSLLIFLLVGSVLSPRIDIPPPSYQVDLIALAQQGGKEGPVVPKDVSGSKPTTAPDADVKPKASDAPKAPETPAPPEKVKIPEKPEVKPEVDKEQEAKEKAAKEKEAKDKEAKEKADKEAKAKADKEAKEKAAKEKAAKEKAALADALAAAQKSAEKNEKPRAAGGDQDIADAISTLRNQESQNIKSGGGEGGGEGAGYGEGVGIDATYTDLITAIIRKNWTFPGMADRSNLVAVVRVTLSSLGEVTGASIEKGSGRPDFDASVLAAIKISNGQLPPPPNPSLQDLRLTFHEAE